MQDWHVTFVLERGDPIRLDLPIADGCGGFRDRRSGYGFQDDNRLMLRCGELVEDWGEPTTWPAGIMSLTDGRGPRAARALSPR